MEDIEIREAILQSQINAVLAGHDIGPFEEVENGYQSRCRQCGLTTWVGMQGLIYSLLDDICVGEEAV